MNKVGEVRRTPIPGDDLRVGDVYLPMVGRRMQVERITLRIFADSSDPLRPLLIAHGPTVFKDGNESSSDWIECYFGDDWVVVER